MAKKLTLYYDDELNSWIESVHFYLGEIHALGIRLDDIIARNSIVDIAAKVEVHQLLLNKINKKLADLLVEIKAQHAAVQKQREEKACDVLLQFPNQLIFSFCERSLARGGRSLAYFLSYQF